MPDSLLFDGIDDFITFSAGDASPSGSSFTVVAIAKLVADEAAYKNLVGLNAIDAGLILTNASPHLLAWYPGSGAAPTSTLSAPTSDGWCLYAFNGDSGNGDFHKYVYGTTTWTHEANATSFNDTPAITDFEIARNGTDSQYFDGNILIAGWWDSILSQATIETLASGLSAWVDAAPTEAWRFDTTSSITPFAGSGSETARTGTTLDTGDAPAGWSDSLTAPPTLRVSRPALRW